jgi:DNA invertase Pin-like site-specific DNA recombinase
MPPRRPAKIVGYLRTSTDDQLLGIDAQDARLREIAEGKGCAIARVFTEHESGGDNERPELDKALRHARRLKATLVVAKLDRLARDQQFLMRLVDGNVPILFGDLPDVDFTSGAAARLHVQILGAFAEFELNRIRERTREALKILKARGVPLGAARPECRNLTAEARARGAGTAARNRVARAIDDQADIASIAAELRAGGASLRQIAAHLNAEGYPTRDGSEFDPATGKGGWSAVQVKRVLDRIRA